MEGKSINDILKDSHHIVKQNESESELFVLIDITTKSGRVYISELFDRYENRLREMYAFGFEDEWYYKIINKDRKRKYVCMVFSIEDLEPVFLMTISKYRLKDWILNDICKKQNHTKRMFSRALAFCFSSYDAMSPTKSNFYMTLDTQNPHLCAALCAYIKSGFIPYTIEHLQSVPYLNMKYDETSIHIRIHQSL